MQKVKGIKLACLAAFAILPVQTYALGVGKLTMNSALDAPLSATIELTAATTAELQSLEISLGSASVFNMAGIDRSEQLKAIRFSLVKVNGKDVIKLDTEQPFRDPFLHFIVKATWANGSMLREYTALLDPPTYLTGAPARIQAPAAAKPVAVKSAEKAPAKKKAAVASPAVDTPVAAADTGKPKLGPLDVADSTESNYSDLRPGSTFGPVRKGDALWDIAEGVKAGTSLGIAQVMMAIYKQNPNAFMQNNINMIRVGQTLDIPSDEEISSTSRPVAQEELRAQMEEWQEYKDNLATGRSVARTDMATAPPVKAGTAEESEKKVSSATEKAESKPQTPDASASTGDVLEIVRAKVEGAETSGTGASAEDREKFESEIEAYKDNVTQLEETLASSELEKMELAERVSLLEEQIDKANKLIDMQNADLARLQSQQQSAPVTPVEMAKLPGKVDVSSTTPEEPATKSAPLSAPDISPVTAAAPEIKKPEVAKKSTVVEKKEAKVRARPQPVEERGILDTAKDIIFSSWITMLGTGLALLLILVGIFVVLRRRRSIAEFEDSIISGTAVLDISTAESSEPSGSGSETSFLSDFVPGMGNMQADEVDPLAEAEVYMAYGRDEQAEEVLKEAAEKNPDRHELKLKLLEIYQGRKDISSFETLAEELYPADGNIPMEVWGKVAEMGKIVNPDNPLFQGDLKLQEETLFGDSDRKEDVPLGDLLDTDTIEAEAADLMEALNDDDVTEEVIEESLSEADDLEAIEGFELPEDTAEMLDQGNVLEESLESSVTKAEDFPAPDEEVLDLDLGDFKPDASQETDSFDLDSIELNLAELDGDTEEVFKESEENLDFNLDGIDLELNDTSEAESESSIDVSGLEDIEGLSLDLESEDTSVNEDASITSEVGLQDETLEFADLGDLTLDVEEADLSVEEAASGTDEEPTEMPAGANETWDEAGTKLDLARAYIEMDDNESAQSILEEVAKEGTDDQKNEARDLMSQIDAG
ncbi:MAG: FimV/HubP family polar landmark protein [Arenicellales bacterium]